MKKLLIGGAALLLSGLALASSTALPVAEPTLAERMQGKPAAERATLKAVAIVDATSPGQYQSDDFRIEITEIQSIEGGVEVFARAWRNGVPLGFGKDGTIETERFRFINPPVLVPDAGGEVVREYEIEGVRKQRRLRSDPQAALRIALAQTIELVGREGAVIAGTRGNTTTTIYPDAHPETSTVDGSVTNGFNANWATVRNGVTGTSANDNAAEDRAFQTHFTGGNYFVQRGFFLFNTASIPDADTVSSATFSLFTGSTGIQTGGGGDVDIVSSSPASNTAIVTADFDQVGSVSFATAALTSLSAGAYNDFSLDANGVANVSKTGVSKFGVRGSKDLDNVAPTGESGWFVYYADQSGTTNDPKLVVVHASASVPEQVIFFE